MKRQAWHPIPALVGVLLVSAVLAACGARGNPASVARTTVPSHDVLYVVDGGAAGGTYDGNSSGASGQAIVAVTADGSARTPLFALPMGLTTLDHQRLYTTTNGSGWTTIVAYDTRSGVRLGAFDIAGSYSVTARGYTGGALSPDGRWLALRATNVSDAATTFAVVDTQARRLAQTITLPGSFDLDAISPGGGMLYLLQTLNDTAHHYYVRAYDLHARQLLDAIIVDKTEWSDGKMQGTAVARQMASDGRVAYTVYIDPTQPRAFVHILPLGESMQDTPPFARCLDLPTGSNPDLLHFYTLALSADGSTLYAANGALGLVNVISLHGQDVYSDQIERTAHFNPTVAGAAAADGARTLYSGTALAADQGTLYVVGLRGVWSVRLSDLAVRQLYGAGQAFTGVALSGDGTRLYAADPAYGVLLIAPATGGTPQAITVPVRSPWGIAWIAG